MTTKASASTRIAGFDVLRAVGAFAVVWIHACDTNDILKARSGWAGFAVPAFALMSGFLLMQKVLGDPRARIHAVLTQRLKRLLPAYCVWTAIYVALRLIRRLIVARDGALLDAVGCIFLGGASYQLYFVAALIYFTFAAIPPAVLASRAARRLPFIGLFLCLAVAVAVWRGPLAALLLRCGGDRWAMLAPLLGTGAYMLMGVALRLAVRDAVHVSPHVRRGLILASCLLLGWYMLSESCRTAALTAAAVCGAFALPTHACAVGVVRRLSEWSFGVFLVHALFVEGLQLVAGIAGMSLSGATATLGVILLAYGLSLVAVALLHAFRYTRWTVA